MDMQRKHASNKQETSLFGSMQMDLESTSSSGSSPQNHTAVQFYPGKNGSSVEDPIGGASRHMKHPSFTDPQSTGRDTSLGPIRRFRSHHGDNARNFLKPVSGHSSKVDKTYRIYNQGSNDDDGPYNIPSRLPKSGKRGKEVRFLPMEGEYSSDVMMGPYSESFDGHKREQASEEERKGSLYHGKLDARAKKPTANHGHDSDIEDRKHAGFGRNEVRKRSAYDDGIQEAKRVKTSTQRSVMAKYNGYDPHNIKGGNTSHLQRITGRGNVGGMISGKPIAYQQLKESNKLQSAELSATPPHPLSIKLAASISSSKDGFHVQLSEELNRLHNLGNLGLNTFIEKIKTYRGQLEEEKPKAFPLCAEESKVFQSFGKSEASMRRIKSEMAASWDELESIDKEIFDLANRLDANAQTLDQTWLDKAQANLDANGKDWIKQMAGVEKRIAATELRDKMRIYKTPW